MNDKPIYVWPGDSRVFDGTRPIVRVGPALLLGTFGFLFFLGLTLLLTWWNIPGLPVPTNQQAPWFHVKAMYHVFLGMLLPDLQTATYRQYVAAVHWWADRGEGGYLLVRYILAIAGGIAGSYYLSRSAWRPVEQSTQVRGRKLLKGKLGFADLKAAFDLQIAAKQSIPPGLIMATDRGFDVHDPKSYGHKAQVIYTPDAQRRTHYLIIGGTRRGKGVKNKEIVTQIYYHKILGQYAPSKSILDKMMERMLGEPEKSPITPHKLIFVDTPKGEYAELFNPRHFVQIAPDEKYSVPHAIARDMLLVQDFAQFANGLIPVNDNDKFWGTAARATATGIGAVLCKEAGTDWSYNNLAYFKDMSPAELEPYIRKSYPELGPILSMAEQTLSSIIGTVATNLMFVNDVARVWDGYDYKVEIHQMSAGLLRKKFWIDFWFDRAYPKTVMIDDKLEVITFNVFTRLILQGHLNTLNAEGKKWKWTELKALLQGNFDQQLIGAMGVATTDDEHKILEDASMFKNYHLEHITPILKWAEVWDGYEARERFSIRDWMLDENPKKKIFLLKPSGRFKSQMDGIIRGILLYMTSMVNDKFFKEDKTKTLPLRNVHLFCDEFQSLGNLKEFVAPALEMFASKGVTLYISCQDFSQLQDTYNENFLKFMQGNTGNILVMGMNQGTSAEMISNLVGKKSISKVHMSKTIQETGVSVSMNPQVHDNEPVITPDEINSLLGAKRNGINYLYLPGNEANAYLMEAPIVDHPKLYTPEPADWIKGRGFKPAKVELDQVKAAWSATGPAHHQVNEEPLRDAADEIEPDLSDEEMDALERATQATERQGYYPMPEEDESMQDTLLKDVAAEMVGGSVAQTVGHVADILTSSHKNVTTDKKKYLAAWKKKNKLDELTQD